MATQANSPPASIGFTCTMEELFIGLEKFTNGSPLPSNVINDVDPYKYEPQNLPDDFWFLSSSKGNTDTEHGLWKISEEALEVFSNSDFVGWRTTLEYYSGQVPYERKTNWVMQVFSTTQKRPSDAYAKKALLKLKDLQAYSLTRFNEVQQNVSGVRIDAENLLPEPPVLDANCSTRIGSSSNPQVNKHDEKEVPRVAERLPAPENQEQNIAEMDFFSGAKNDFFSEGDFLELNDLDNPASSSRSYNSSAMSFSSDEYFDSMAFLQELDQDQVLEHNDTGKNLDVSASNIPDEVVIVPAPLAGSLVSIEGSDSDSDELFKTTSFAPNSASGGEGPWSPSSSSSGDGLDRRMGDDYGRMKELRKKCTCFMPF
ncbi:hypothetical protein V6N13_001365 [Hibiscus sabdariffa]